MPPRSSRRTKIVATLGPATSSRELIARLVEAGADAMRLNFSHGTHEEHAERARLVRELQAEAGRPLALIADLQGPKLRVGDLAEPAQLETGTEVAVSGEPPSGPGQLQVLPAVIGELLAPGNRILIDDGHVHLRVERIEADRAVCRVVVGGVVSSHKGVNLPGVAVPIPSLTEKDLADLHAALELGADYVALSFVRGAADVHQLRQILEARGSEARIIAKIEKAEAVEALDEILAASDAVMVARGDLGVEIGPAGVPLLQKRIILDALELGKPVITATQMLESMIHQPDPTRAEASDVANAILDGTSAVMLSGETAAGEYPVEAVETMDLIARTVEPSLGYRHQTPAATEAPTVDRAMSNAACDLAETLGAVAILVPTWSGRTASAVARLRPRRPIIGITYRQTVAQQMALEWGVEPIVIAESRDIQDIWARAIEAARQRGVVQTGDRVVVTAGTAVNIPGSTNVIKIDVA